MKSPRAKNTEKILRETLGLFDNAATAEAEPAQEQTLKYLEAHRDDVVQHPEWQWHSSRPVRTRLLVLAAAAAAVTVAVLIPITMRSPAPGTLEIAGRKL